MTHRASRRTALAILLAGTASAALAQSTIGKLVPAREPRAPALELKDLEGKLHRLADYRGRVVLVNFWATWCVPCREEMPSMQQLAKSLADRPFAVLAVNYGESAERAGGFARQTGFELPILLDAFQQARQDWRVRVLPASFLLDAEGRVRYTVQGEIDWASADTLRIVRGLLPK